MFIRVICAHLMNTVDAVTNCPVKIWSLQQNKKDLFPLIFTRALHHLTWSAVRQSLVYFLMQVTNSDHVLGNRTLKKFNKSPLIFTLYVSALTCRHDPHPHWLQGRHIGDPQAKDRRAWCTCWVSLFCNPACLRPPDSWLGLERELRHFTEMFQKSIHGSSFSNPPIKIPVLCLCSRLISCNIINNKNRDMLRHILFIERPYFLSFSFSWKFKKLL